MDIGQSLEQGRGGASPSALSVSFAEGESLAGAHRTEAEQVSARPIPDLAEAESLAVAMVRRCLDVLVSLALLVISAPVALVVAILIRIDSPGPIVFRQVRLGRYGRPFNFYKFRTMWVDARERFPELYTYSYSDDEIRTMYFKVLQDPRLTRMGTWLRKTSLDELPNLFNVVSGQMSLVGPRPELPEMLGYYTDEQLVKFAVKPGVTGLAQVTGRAVLRFQETIATDVGYCQRRSLWLDVKILLRTVKVVIERAGAF